MKRIIVIALLIICGVALSESFAQTASALSLYQEMMKLEEERAELEKTKVEQEKATKEEVTFPCQDAVQNDDDYYGAWGKGKGKDQRMAVESALRKAQYELSRQVGGETVELNEIESVCRLVQRTENGYFIAYVAIRMLKNK